MGYVNYNFNRDMFDPNHSPTTRVSSSAYTYPPRHIDATSTSDSTYENTVINTDGFATRLALPHIALSQKLIPYLDSVELSELQKVNRTVFMKYAADALVLLEMHNKLNDETAELVLEHFDTSECQCIVNYLNHDSPITPKLFKVHRAPESKSWQDDNLSNLSQPDPEPTTNEFMEKVERAAVGIQKAFTRFFFKPKKQEPETKEEPKS